MTNFSLLQHFDNEGGIDYELLSKCNNYYN